MHIIVILLRGIRHYTQKKKEKKKRIDITVTSYRYHTGVIISAFIIFLTERPTATHAPRTIARTLRHAEIIL